MFLDSIKHTFSVDIIFKTAIHTNIILISKLRYSAVFYFFIRLIFFFYRTGTKLCIILESHQQIVLCCMNVKIANFGGTCMLICIWRYVFHLCLETYICLLRNSITTVLAVALAVSNQHSVYGHIGNLFFISHAVTGV